MTNSNECLNSFTCPLRYTEWQAMHLSWLSCHIFFRSLEESTCYEVKSEMENGKWEICFKTLMLYHLEHLRKVLASRCYLNWNGKWEIPISSFMLYKSDHLKRLFAARCNLNWKMGNAKYLFLHSCFIFLITWLKKLIHLSWCCRDK